jgi:hypothetical protein
MNSILKSALATAGLALSTQAAADITFYEHEGFQGRNFASAKEVRDFGRIGFNDRASSVLITGGERWEVCENARFAGRCIVLRPGQYGSLAAMGLNDRVSSVRIVVRNARVEDSRYAPAPVAVNDYRRRNKERVFEAEVTSARAVMGPAEQRCWVEREQVSSGQGNMGGGLMGAVIGGILAHQMGGGSAQGYGQNVQRCSSVPGQSPAYWDVTYNFRGREHRMQMSHDPGRSVNVNSKGEPRA